MSICYLEVDDEITSAIGRIRAVTDGEAVVVVPSGSRVATSRINFKLLAREANERRLNIVVVSDEPAARALAISAGLPSYDSIAAAEQALANFREQDRQLAERIGRPLGEAPPPRATDTTGTLVLPSPLREAPGVGGRARPGTDSSPTETEVLRGIPAPRAAAPLAGPTAAEAELDQPAERPSARRRRRRRRRVGVAPLLVIGLLALLVAGVAYGAYVFLPTATITIRPQTSELRLSSSSVTADPGVAVMDVDAGIVPAEWVDVPVHVTGSFAANGVEVRETRANGAVRFRSENTVNTVAIPAETIVATADGIEFLTADPVTVPRADFSTGTPGTVDVAVRAVRVGPAGNVAAAAITELPASLAAQLISVRNPQPTSGGRRIEESVVTQADYDAALAALATELDPALAAALADPANVPGGLTVFPATAQLGDATPDLLAAALVGTLVPTFSLALDATGQAIAVNEGLIDELAAARLRANLPIGQTIVGDEVASTRSPGEVAGDAIVYQVAPSALVYSEPDSAAVIAEVRGKTVTEARQLLARYGTVEIVIWPDFIDRLPDQTARISLTISPPSAGT